MTRAKDGNSEHLNCEFVVVDGPYAEAKDIIGGYLSIEAKDLNQATELAKGCPILNIGGSVEVRQVQIVNM